MASEEVPVTMFQEMCGGAKKLQEVWEPKVGDRVLLPVGVKILKLIPKGKKGMIWLPYDHQMYGMLGVNNLSTSLVFVLHWRRRYEIDRVPHSNTNPSVAQLWLEIVMKGVFQQAWDNAKREFADIT